MNESTTYILNYDRKLKAICWLLFNRLLLSGLVLLPALPVLAQINPDSVRDVFIMEIRATIDPRTNRSVELALEEATNLNTDLVIIDMDTYGGALNDADEIRTRVLEYEKPVWVFINKDAASAGALISIACDSIYMAPGASIGAATVVTGNTGEAAPDKYQSYMRSIMRSTAEAKGRDPKIAEAMVDENLYVEGVSDSGTVITFSTSEAIKYGFCEAQVNSVDDILERSGIENAIVTRYQLSMVDQVVDFFINPLVSGVLILVILGGIYFELQTPGVGFPILASAVALTLYLTPYYLNGLAENWEILLFFIGVLLIALEIFVIPGFGIAGISGVICSVGSLILIMLNNDNLDFTFVDSDRLFQAVVATLAGLLGSIIVMFFGGVRLANSKVFERIALTSTQERSEGYTSSFRAESFVGKEGTAYTVLRPGGKVMINNDLYDAYTRGEYIDRDETIVVVSDEGTSLRVRKK